MIDGITFERSPWEQLTDTLAPGSTLSALGLLSALEGEEYPEDALEALGEKGVRLDISALPPDFGSGPLEKQLRMEARLVQTGEVWQLSPQEGLGQYLNELAQIPAQGDAELLAQELLEGSPTAGRQLMNLHLGMAARAAMECTGRGITLMDLIQEAGLGLWEGILSYTGGPLQPHLQAAVEFALARAVVLQARQNGTLERARESMERFQTAQHTLRTRLGREPQLPELAQELGLSLEQAEALEDMLRSAQAMAQVKAPAQDTPEEEAAAVEDTAYFRTRQRVRELLEALTPQQAQVLSGRFGLEGAGPLSHQALAARMGLTPAQVEALEAQALEKLRKEG